MTVAVLGAGAFGTALAVAIARSGRCVRLWGRNSAALADLQATRRSEPLQADLPPTLDVEPDLAGACDEAGVLLLAVPAQALPRLCSTMPALRPGQVPVACCKGLNVETGLGPTDVLRGFWKANPAMVLTGPSFAADIARGLPTALTLACHDPEPATRVQSALATDVLRIYTGSDPKGAELGGALKNVIAIACGVVIGAGLGDSARAALMTRGFAEMRRMARPFGADPETLTGLSGLGDLSLTCTSPLSRNYRFGLALGQGRPFGDGVTVEGATTAQAVDRLAARLGVDMPVCTAVAALLRGELDVRSAMTKLLSRPLKEE